MVTFISRSTVMSTKGIIDCILICVYFYDDVSGCFYPFVNKIELS